jgi:hypothetical protein
MNPLLSVRVPWYKSCTLLPISLSLFNHCLITDTLKVVGLSIVLL